MTRQHGGGGGGGGRNSRALRSTKFEMRVSVQSAVCASSLISHPLEEKMTGLPANKSQNHLSQLLHFSWLEVSSNKARKELERDGII